MKKTTRMPDCHELTTQGWRHRGIRTSLGAVNLSDRVAVPRAPWLGSGGLGDCAPLEIDLMLLATSRMLQSKGAPAAEEA